jgi:hypothetical protein
MLETCTNVLLITNIILMFVILLGGIFIFLFIKKILEGRREENYKMICTKSFPSRCFEQREDFNIFDNENDEMINALNDYQMSVEADRRLAMI